MTAPVILLGMHRSGTSMVTHLLAELGLFVGWELEANAEAVFFLLRNEAILAAQGARWDQPHPVDALLSHDQLRQRMAEALRGELRSAAVLSFLGPSRYLRYRSPLRMEGPWGWKDPRNTLLLPLWLDVFPQAKVIHVVRNGVDVALSLARRERSRLDHLLGNRGRLVDVVGGKGRPDRMSRLVWTWLQVRLRLSRGGLRRRLGRWRFHPSIDVEKGFELWSEYLKRADHASSLVEGGLFEVRYEDILTAPAEQLGRLATYCGLRPDANDVAAVCDLVRPEGMNRFKDDPAASRLYDTVRDSEWMRRWEYDRC